jgi:small GTP-binding protein
MATPSNVMKLKVALLGEEGVGKTSLIHRFVSGAFDPAYIRTLGVVVSKKTVDIEIPGRGPTRAYLMIHDVMGHQSFLRLFKESYFQGVQGVLAVFDSTRLETLQSLPRWIDAAQDVVGSVPLFVLANKTDLGDRNVATVERISEALGRYRCDVLRSSAKTGENVEEAFRRVAGAILETLPVVESA